MEELVSAAIEKEKDSLQKLSTSIWEKPELCYKEFHAHSVLTAALERYGFEVEKHFQLETAFRAQYSNGVKGPTVGILCEYDALPDIGHACGHNLIAEVGIAAAIAVKAAMLEDPTLPGKVVVLGCPAEEGGGGKIRLIERGVFKDIDVALMAHPGSNNRVVPHLLCRLSVDVTYKGKEAHASCYPWEGRNALDAAVAAYNNIGLLRQHIKPDCRIHGIITNGGSAPNVIPGKSALRFFIRAPTRSNLQDLKVRTQACFESAAKATGCGVECDFQESNVYLNIIPNPVLNRLYRQYSESMGVAFVDDAENKSQLPKISGSSDIGNVSYEVPSLHADFRIGPYGIHTPEFVKQAVTDEAHRAARTTAKALASTAIEILKTPSLLKEAKAAFKQNLSRM